MRVYCFYLIALRLERGRKKKKKGKRKKRRFLRLVYLGSNNTVGKLLTELTLNTCSLLFPTKHPTRPSAGAKICRRDESALLRERPWMESQRPH